jgi:hypothetical protein
VNIDEDTINILVVPWPVDMKAAWFKPVPHFVRRRSAEPARYFSYSGAPEEMLIERILPLLLCQERRYACRSVRAAASGMTSHAC